MITPGSVTYTASMLGLFIAAIAFGERIGHLDSARVEALVDRIARPFRQPCRRRTRPSVRWRRKSPATFTRERKTVILGGGPNYATAYFGMAKWFEGLTRPCHPAELEEWAHEQYFFTDEMTDTFILAAPGGGHDRALEQAQAARDMGSRVILIGREGDAAAKAASDIYFGMPDLPEALTPFVYKLPFEYLCCHIADQQNIAFLGFDNHSGVRKSISARSSTPLRRRRSRRSGSDERAAVAVAFRKEAGRGHGAVGGARRRQPLSRWADRRCAGGAIGEAEVLATHGVDALMVQNLGDIPTDLRATTAQAAWMTRIVDEVRRRTGKPTGLNMLENDAEAMIAVASASQADFVRIKIYVGAMLTPFGVESAQAFAAIRARTAWRADDVAILADVHDRTGIRLSPAASRTISTPPSGSAPRTALVLTGKTYQGTLTLIATARQVVAPGADPRRRRRQREQFREVQAVADGVIVSSSLKGTGTAFGRFDAGKVREFMAVAGAPPETKEEARMKTVWKMRLAS